MVVEFWQCSKLNRNTVLHSTHDKVKAAESFIYTHHTRTEVLVPHPKLLLGLTSIIRLLVQANV